MKPTRGNFLSQQNKDFPVDAELFDSLQTNNLITTIIGNLGGDQVILYGCELEPGGATRKPGYVFLRTAAVPTGEVLYWEGGAVSSGMVVKQENISVSSQGYIYTSAYARRTLVAGIGGEHFFWDGFEQITSRELDSAIKGLSKRIDDMRVSPLGIVEMWSGKVGATDLPINYMLCAGQLLTELDYPEIFKVIGRTHTPSSVGEGFFCLPDLRSRFVVGYNGADDDYKIMGNTGGEKAVQLKEADMPSHSHDYYLNPGANGNWKGGGANSPNSTTVNPNSYSKQRQTDKTGGEIQNIDGKDVVVTRFHENRPPYYTLAYIMRIR